SVSKARRLPTRVRASVRASAACDSTRRTCSRSRSSAWSNRPCMVLLASTSLVTTWRILVGSCSLSLFNSVLISSTRVLCSPKSPAPRRVQLLQAPQGLAALSSFFLAPRRSLRLDPSGPKPPPARHARTGNRQCVEDLNRQSRKHLKGSLGSSTEYAEVNFVAK